MSLKEKKLCYLRIPNFVINIYRNIDQNLRHMVTGTIPIKWLQNPADLATFTEEILNGKDHFLCSVKPTSSI